ncbi:Camphor resistance [Fusarium mexicanum]|uniref:Camphor resistance n=1 Tax=Fusarium mexicanum TaxID=751941 RepID=A0A8H5N033_9HYPO|nr:Camphor resistance [Fusarium mexicanum]
MGSESTNGGLFNGITEVEEPAPIYDPGFLYPSNDEPPQDDHEMTSQVPFSHETSPVEPNFTPDAPENVFIEDARSKGEEEGYDPPANFANLTEMGAGLPVENPDEQSEYRHSSLEQRQSHRLNFLHKPPKSRRASLAAEFVTIAYLIFFSFCGTLAREALASLTSFISVPDRYTSLWPNFAGTLILGFLSEGAALFRHPSLKRSIARPSSPHQQPRPETSPVETEESIDAQRQKDQEEQPPLPVPLHIGLAVGFCRSLTTFSGFMKDCFLALSNSLGDEGGAMSSLPGRGSGQDVMALLAVVIVTVSVCAAALKAGAHLAILFRSVIRKRLPKNYTFWADRITAILAFGVWIAVIILLIVPPQNNWRGQILFSLAFAPAGCILRFYLSIHLNNRVPAFPLGTFTANMIGTLLLSSIWDIQRSSVGGGRLSCQAQQGIIDGFCGCLTTVSTWINELCALRRVNAYIYALATLVGGLVIVVVVMGVMKWVAGWNIVACTISWA